MITSERVLLTAVLAVTALLAFWYGVPLLEAAVLEPVLNGLQRLP